MFLTEKRHSPLPSSKHHPNPSPYPVGSDRFGSNLSARLRSLLPIPVKATSSAIPLSWLSRLADLLAVTLSEAAAAVSASGGRGSGDAAALAGHLDSGVCLLDSCNAIAARLELLRRRRLLLRFALHLLPSSPSRARAALVEYHHSPPPPPLLPLPAPRGDASSVGRVIHAVEALSSLVVAAAAAALGNGDNSAVSSSIRIAGDFPWAEDFNKISDEIARRLGGGVAAGEVESVEDAVRKLTTVMRGGEGEEEKTEALRSAAEEVEKRTEDLTAGLDRFADAVNGVFRAALCLRNGALSSFRVGTQRECK